MSVTVPYPRIARPFVGPDDTDWDGTPDPDVSYVRQPGFKAPDRASLLRSFRVMDSDLARLFEFIEPHSSNATAFSYRTYELLLRACMEVESHCRAVLTANGLQPPKKGDPTPNGGTYKSKPRWSLAQYKQLDPAMRLSEYEVRLPQWIPVGGQQPSAADQLLSGFKPFQGWGGNSATQWWSEYNKAKHNRSEDFERAALDNVVRAVSAVLILVCAQFGPGSLTEFTANFGAGWISNDGWMHAGSHMEIRLPIWPDSEKYGFNHEGWTPHYAAYHFSW